MSKILPLLRGSIDLQTALEDDDNILQQLTYPEKRIEFFVHLHQHRRDIEALVAHHLGLSDLTACQISEVSEWRHGSFNVCIPIYVKAGWYTDKRVLIRFPLPYKVGESTHAGNGDEKVRCEVATYIWVAEHCPSIPLPKLLGFGLANGSSFIQPQNMCLYRRLIWRLQRLFRSFLRLPLPCQYAIQRVPWHLGMEYIVLEYVEGTTGHMLSSSWSTLRHDPTRRANLFRDLSRIMLALANQPFPRISSLTTDNEGFVHPTNRPLTLRLHHMENEGICTDIPRDLTYCTSEAYVLDLLRCHDNQIRHKPNAIFDEYDGRAQMASLAAMRAIHPHYLRRDLRQGPFVLTLTDLHQSNIFVDDEWHIRCLIDLEWACALPADMLQLPWWLDDRGIDEMPEGEHLDSYCRLHDEFIQIFEKEEKLFQSNGKTPALPFAEILRTNWKNGNFWFFGALDNPKALYRLFLDHIQRRFDPTQDLKFDDIVSRFWSVDAAEVIERKLKDKEDYDARLRKTFEEETAVATDETA